MRSGNQPARSRHRSRPLSQTVRRLAQAPPTPFIDGRKSVASHRTPMPICVQRPKGAEIPRSANSLPRRAIALGCSPAPCAGSRKHRRRRLSMVEHWSYRPPMQSIGVTGYPRSGKLPAPPRHRSSALSQTVRGQGDAALTRRIAPSRSAQLGSSPILKSDYRRRSSTPCVRLRGCLCACVCVYTIAVGCPSFTLCQELNTDGRFERSMVENRSHLPSPRAERCAFFGWFAGCF